MNPETTGTSEGTAPAPSRETFLASLQGFFPDEVYRVALKASGGDGDPKDIQRLRARLVARLSGPGFYDTYASRGALELGREVKRVLAYEAARMVMEQQNKVQGEDNPRIADLKQPYSIDAIPARDLKTTYPQRQEGAPARVVLEHKPTGKHFLGEGTTVDEAMAKAKEALRSGLCQ